MNTYQKSGFEFFFDTNIRLWILYPIDEIGNRIEHDSEENPIEVLYFVNRKHINSWLKNKKNQTI